MTPELQKIFTELSWTAKVKLLDKYFPNPDRENWTMDALMYKRSRTPGPISLNSRRFNRKVGVQALQAPNSTHSRRQVLDQETGDHAPPTEDERNMKLKLFRLMYETVRDSDLKVKRAELIKTHYTNSSSFDVGFVLGDVTEKFNVMTDIAATLKRLYVEWKPIEHINAYEQIANQAIEINHLVDIVRSVQKREATLKESDKVHKLEQENKRV